MSFEDPTDDELRLLLALVGMSEQFLGASPASLEHSFIGAAEHAIQVLGKYGLVVCDGRGGAWTTKAEVLARLDPTLSNSEQIREELRRVPAGELRTFPPGVRAHRPDIWLDNLRIWVPDRAMNRRIRPQWSPQPGPDRLNVEARLSAGGCEAVVRGEILTTGELRAFRNQLAEMVDGSARRAHLVALKECLEITLILDSYQKFTGEITIRNPDYKYSANTEIESRDINLEKTIDSINKILAKFA